MFHRLDFSFAVAVLMLLSTASTTPVAAEPEKAEDLKKAQEYFDKHMSKEQRDLAEKLAKQMGITPAELMLRLGLDNRTLGEDSDAPRVPDPPPSGESDGGGGGSSGGGSGGGNSGDGAAKE